MPHLRHRHIGILLDHISKMSPLTGVLGHRQVGKTTLLEKISHHYLTFDDEEILQEANRSPKKFLLDHNKLKTALDEVQLAERIFPALKERVRTDKRPGQFFLSGSVRFTSKKIIRESLTGRIINLELLPLTLSELAEMELPGYMNGFQNVRSVHSFRPSQLPKREFMRRMSLIEKYLSQGGLPGVCFIRNENLREKKIIAQFETILDRDLRQVQKTTLSLRELLSFVRQLAVHDGHAIQYAEIQRETGLSPITQKKLLYALEAIFVLRFLPIEGGVKGNAIFFEDQAEALTLSLNRIESQRQWSNLIYRNIREQIFYRIDQNAEFFQYSTRGKAFVPFAIRTPDITMGFIPERGPVSRSARTSAQSFLKHYANSIVIHVTDQDASLQIDDRSLVIPAPFLLFE